jgi:LPXTG-motif cell wall-anchored protein
MLMVFDPIHGTPSCATPTLALRAGILRGFGTSLALVVYRFRHQRGRSTMGKRYVVTTGMILGIVLGFAVPGHAKGENGTVVIDGPGLVAPIELRHDDAVLWFSASGVWEPKWPDPVVDGRMRSSVDLGVAYEVEARFGLPECPETVHEVLYPFAAGGPQVFVAAGEHLCGNPVSDGYFPPSQDLMDALVAKGLPTQTATVSNVEPDVAVAARDTGNGTLITAAVGVVVLAGSGGLFLRLRKRRRA